MVIGRIDRSDNDDATKAHKGRTHMCIDWLLFWKLCYLLIRNQYCFGRYQKTTLLYFVWLASVSVWSCYIIKPEIPARTRKAFKMYQTSFYWCMKAFRLSEGLLFMIYVTLGDYCRFTLYDHPVDYEKLSIILFSKLIGERKSIPVSFVFIVVNVLSGSADLFI